MAACGSLAFFLFRAAFLVVLRGGFRDVVEEFLGEVQREDGVVALRFVLERGKRVRAAALLDELAVLADLEGRAGKHGVERDESVDGVEDFVADGGGGAAGERGRNRY